MASGGAESAARAGKRGRGIYFGDTAAGNSDYSDERCGLWGTEQRGEWAVLDGVAFQCGSGGKLGSGGCVRVWDGDREGATRTGIQHDAGRRRKFDARTAERANV